MFKTGDYCLYNYNVCKVVDVTKIKDRDYYVLTPINDSSLTIKAPKSQENINIRPLLSKDEIKTLLSSLKDIKLIEITGHSAENEYKRLLNTGNREDLVRIIKTTYLRNKSREEKGKKIGEKDDTYFHLAEKTLYSEIGTVLNMSIDEAKDYVLNFVNK